MSNDENSKLLESYHTIVKQLMFQAKKGSRMTIKEFMEKLVLE